MIIQGKKTRMSVVEEGKQGRPEEQKEQKEQKEERPEEVKGLKKQEDDKILSL